VQVLDFYLYKSSAHALAAEDQARAFLEVERVAFVVSIDLVDRQARGIETGNQFFRGEKTHVFLDLAVEFPVDEFALDFLCSKPVAA